MVRELTQKGPWISDAVWGDCDYIVIVIMVIHFKFKHAVFVILLRF